MIFKCLTGVSLLVAAAWPAMADAVKVMDVTSAGVLGDGVTLNTAGINLDSSENVRVRNCDVVSGDLRNVTIRNITMDGVVVPISLRLGARLKTFRDGDEPRPAPGQLRDVTIQNVTANNVEMIGLLINGVPGHPVEALRLENIQMELPGGGTADDAKVQLPEKETAYPEYNTFGTNMPAYGIYARHVRGVKFQNVRTSLLKPDARPATVLVDVEDVTPANFGRD
jgi:hypothetical protein